MNKKNFEALFTWESLLSLQGAAAAALMVPSVLTYLIGSGFQPYEKWLALGISVLLAFLVALQTPDKSWNKWLVMVLNACLIFASAVGLTEALSGGKPSGDTAQSMQSLPFFHSWYP